MENEEQMQALLKAARAGEEGAETEFFSHLAVRFLPLVTGKLQKHPLLKKSVDIETQAPETCQSAIETVKKLMPISSKQWSLKRALFILYNDVDDFIINKLTGLAKAGNANAENLLFLKIREKLEQRIAIKRKRSSNYESKYE